MFLDYTPPASGFARLLHELPSHADRPEFKTTLDVWPKLQAKIFETSEHQQFFSFVCLGFIKASISRSLPGLRRKVGDVDEYKANNKWLKEAWLAPSVRIAVTVCLTIAILCVALMGYRTFQNQTVNDIALPTSYLLDNVVSTSVDEDFQVEGFTLPNAGLLFQSETFLIEDALIIFDKPKHLTF
jgi:hypothetical protein